MPPTNPQSSLHQLEKEPNVTLLPEELFNELETLSASTIRST